MPLDGAYLQNMVIIKPGGRRWWLRCVVASEWDVRTKVKMVMGVCVCVSHEIYLSVNLYCVCSLKEPGEIASCVSGREVH